MFYQLAENERRVSFNGQGTIQGLDLPGSRGFDDEGWVLLYGPRLYMAIIEDWEDMSQRLVQLQQALEVTDEYYGSDAPDQPGVEWYDMMAW